MSEPLAAVSDYDGLLSALRARVVELNITHANLDDVSGIQSGYASKLLANPPIKTLGLMSLGSVLGALGLKLLVVEDAEALKRVANMQIERRHAKGPASMHSITVHIKISGRKLKRAQRKGGANSRKFLSRYEARKLARRAATARWARRALRLQRAAERRAAEMAKQQLQELLTEFDPPSGPCD